MEELYAYAFLWLFGFISEQEYFGFLDAAFMSEPYNKTLFSLEECISDARTSFGILSSYFERCGNEPDIDLFGRTLFGGIEKRYCSECDSIEDLADKCCNLFEHLPEGINKYDERPFRYLSCMDDVMLCNGEKYAREVLEEAFEYYNSAAD